MYDAVAQQHHARDEPVLDPTGAGSKQGLSCSEPERLEGTLGQALNPAASSSCPRWHCRQPQQGSGT